jgi:hypothetical protein
MKRLIPVLAVLAGCMTTNSPAATGVRVADPEAVAGCTRVGKMSAVPGLYGIFAAEGVAEARRAVLKGAAEQGANTVAFDRVEPGTTVTQVTAATYRC